MTMPWPRVWIGICSFSKVSGRKAKKMNIKDDLGLPPLVSLDKLEAMKDRGFRYTLYSAP
jgi:hypothetical protein